VIPERRGPLDLVGAIEWLWENSPPYMPDGWPGWHPDDAAQTLQELGCSRTTVKQAFRRYEDRMYSVLAWRTRLAEPNPQQGLRADVIALRCSGCGKIVQMTIRELCHVVPRENPAASSPFRYRCPVCKADAAHDGIQSP
jgi:hypothetical protein